MIVSASALVRHCGYARALKRARPKSASAQEACDRGTKFHAYVEHDPIALSRGQVPQVDGDDEMQGWLDMLATSDQFRPTVNVETEILWGLGFDGQYVQPVETSPHVYEPAPGQPSLLTAGRADIAWERRGCIYVGDWKTGKWPATPAGDNLQVNAAGMALAARTNSPSYLPMVYYARDGYWDVGREVVIGTADWMRVFGEVRTASLLDETPRPGPHCASCWERKGCAHATTGGAR